MGFFDFLGTAAKDTKNATVGSWHFLNTAARDTGGAIAAGNRFLNTAGQNLVIDPVKSTMALPINFTKAVAANVTNNPTALANARAQEAKSLPAQFAQGTARSAAEIAATVGNRSYTPGTKTEQQIFGEIPVQSVQQKVSDTYSRFGSSTNPVQRGLAGPAAAGEAVLSFLQDAPVAAGGVVGAIKGVKTAKKASEAAAPKIANAAVNADKAVFNPRLRVEEQAALKTVSDYLHGSKDVTPSDYSAAIKVATPAAKAQGIDIVGGSVRDRQVAVNGILDQIGQHRNAVATGGYVGGSGAPGFAEADKAGKTFGGADNKPRFEVDDSKATVTRVKPGYNDSLSNVLQHPTLYKDYPQLADTTVSVQQLPKGAKAVYVPEKNLIAVSPEAAAKPSTFKSALLHETQHAIQRTEGLATGTNLRDANYKNNAGEIEARQVQDRAAMTPEQRAANPINREKLAKTDNVNDIKRTLQQDNVTQPVAEKIAPAIAQTKDPNIVNNIVDRATVPVETNRPVAPAQEVTVPASPEVNTVPNPVKNIVEALNGGTESPSVRTLQQKQNALYTQERRTRLGKASAAGENLSGRQATYAQLGALKGGYPKVSGDTLVEHLRNQVSPEDLNGVLDTIRTSTKLSGYEPIRAQAALLKLFDEGKVPTPSDMKLFEKAVGSDFTEAINRNVSLFKRAKSTAAEVIGVPRAIMASGDISFGGRQALAYATSHPVKFAEQWVKQFQYFKEGLQGSEPKALQALQDEIKSHPDYKLLQQAKVAVTDITGSNPYAREESLVGANLAEKIPILGRLVKGSDYAFTGLANSVRANEFYAQLEHARQANIPLTDKLLKNLGEVINTATGRGSIKALESHMNTLSTSLFAPRLILSRFQAINPQYYIKLEPLARKEALRNLMGLSAFAVGILGIAKLAGAEVGTEPTSSNFGKVKIGDTRIDFLGGYQQLIKLGFQLAEGKTVSSLTGKENQLGSGFGQQSRASILANYFQNKENPVASFVTTLLKGKDVTGNPVTTPKEIGGQVLQRFIPLIAQDYNDLRTHPNGLNPIIGGALSAVGVSTQTYGTKDIKISDKQQQYVDYLKSNGAPKAQVDATQSFYQTLKTTPDRNQASQQINDALKSGNVSKAQQIAQQYNKAYTQTFKTWAKQYNQYASDRELLKAYNANKLTLTPASIRTRQKKLKQDSLYSATLGGK